MNLDIVKSFGFALKQVVGFGICAVLLSLVHAAKLHAQTVSVELLSLRTGNAGAWNNFNANSLNNAYALQFSLVEKMAIKRITLQRGGTWDTGEAMWYPIVVTDTVGKQLNFAYGQEFGPFDVGSHTLILYTGGVVIDHGGPWWVSVEFSNGVNKKFMNPDRDADGVFDFDDVCPEDSRKAESSGICGCGKADDLDTDGDQIPDCLDKCPANPAKAEPGACGCEIAETDKNKNQLIDCVELRSLSAPSVIVRGTTANVLVPVKGFRGFTVSVVKKKQNQIVKSFKKSQSSGNSATFTLTPGRWTATYKIQSGIKQLSGVQSKAKTFTVQTPKKKSKKKPTKGK